MSRRTNGHWRFNQFALPRGFMGRVAGYLMAMGNADMARQVVDMLAPAAEDRVLEIGFGPGVAIELLARRATQGYVAGVDPSEVMLGQARRRNRSAIAQGRVDLRLGSSATLPWEDASFDKVCSINNVMLWDIEHDLREVHRVLKHGGLLLVAVHAWALQDGKAHITARGGELPFLG